MDDDLDPLMPIGMFSRSSLVSIKALRSYHEQGLLVPAETDPTTGYRSYRVSQLVDATVIKRLRALDVPLRDIAEVVAAHDPDVTRAVIDRHAVEMKERLAETERIVSELQQTIEFPSLATPVHVRVEAATHALAISGVAAEAEYSTFLDGAYARLWGALEVLGATASGPSGARYPAMVESTENPVEAFVPIAAPVVIDEALHATGVDLVLLPEATCAVASHVGSYATIDDTYRQLGSWVARTASSAEEQPVREHYVVSIDPASGQLLPDDQLRTEIAWPVVGCEPTSRINQGDPS